MYKFIVVFVLAIAITLSVAGCGDDATTAINSRVVKASGHPQWWPIMWADNGKMVGVGPEVTLLAFKDMGMQTSFTEQGNWEEVLNKAKSGEVEVIVGAYKTQEREQYMVYSNAYAIDPISLFVNKGSTINYNTWQDLKSLKLVATIGDSYGELFDKFIIDNNLDVVRVETVAEAFDYVATKKADGFLYSYYSGIKYMHDFAKENDFMALEPYITQQDFFICISKKSDLSSRINEVNAAIKKYQDNGVIQQLIDKHLNELK